MLCKPVASIILHTAAFLIAGNQQLLVRSLVSLLLVPMASLLPTTHILSLHRTEKRKRIWKRGYTRFRLVRSGRTSKLFSCFYLNFFFFACFYRSLCVLYYSTPCVIASNAWDHVSEEGEFRPPSLQEHTALTYKVRLPFQAGSSHLRTEKADRPNSIFLTISKLIICVTRF